MALGLPGELRRTAIPRQVDPSRTQVSGDARAGSFSLGEDLQGRVRLLGLVQIAEHVILAEPRAHRET